MTGLTLSVGVLGAGIVGRTLAAGWARAGHRVLLGSRNPADPRLVSHLQAAREADVAVVTVPGDQVSDLVAGLDDALSGTPVIDATNRVGTTGPLHALGTLRAAGAVPYRAYSTTGWEQLANPLFGAVRADLPYAGPDSHAGVVEQLIRDTGFRPVALGDSDAAVESMDALTRLWFLLAFQRGYGRRLGLRWLTADDDGPTG